LACYAAWLFSGYLKFGKVFGITTKTSVMNRIGIVITALLILITVNSCSKKNHPSTAASTTTTPAAPKKSTVKRAVPKVIAVNPKAAKRSIDGRYYYDLEGHRYWRNNRDGKYYLFHKSMFDNPDFKSPGN
jgi:hypothetical protein